MRHTGRARRARTLVRAPIAALAMINFARERRARRRRAERRVAAISGAAAAATEAAAATLIKARGGQLFSPPTRRPLGPVRGARAPAQSTASGRASERVNEKKRFRRRN